MDDDQLTAEEQAALDAQRNAPEPEATEPAPDVSETPQEGAGEGDGEPEAPEQPDVGKRPQTVPHAALHAERVRRQEVERQAAEDRRRYEARLEEVLKLVPQPAAQTETPQAPVIPDVQADPVGHIVGTLQQLGASQQQIQQAVEQQRAQQQQQQLVAAVQQRAAAMETDYRAQNPEYDSAMTFLRSFRDRQLQAAGIADPGQRAQQIATEAFQIAASALQQGGNPAERLHRLAEASGWAAPAADPAPNGQAPAGQAPGVPDQAARLQMVQRGQEHARGLGNVRGNGPSPMTAAKLLDIPDENFDDIIKAMKSPGARRLMGA